MAFLKFKRSAVPAKIPSIADIDLGEIAINTYDGKLYTKKQVGSTQTIVDVGGGAGTVSSVAGTGTVNGISLTGTVTTAGNLTLGGTLSGVSLATQVTGTLPVANGGTGATTLTGYTRGNGTGAFTASASIPSTDISGLGTMSTQAATAVAITGGTINGTTIGATALAAGSFTTLSATGDLSTGPRILTGTGVSTGGVVIEHGLNRSADGVSLFDFHSQAGIDFNARLLRAGGANGNFEITNTGTGSVTVTTSGAERLRITAAGDVVANIGMQAPIFRDDNDTAYFIDLNATYSAQIRGDGSVNGSSAAGPSIWSQGGNGAIMSFHRANNFAINFGLDSDNVIRLGGWSAQSNRLQIDMSGNLTMAGNVTAFSDARLKKDIETISGAVELVCSMRGVRFTHIETERRGVGVIAQEMLEVLPEVVQQGTGDETTLSVAYGNIVGVLIEAVKELKAEIETLKARG